MYRKMYRSGKNAVLKMIKRVIVTFKFMKAYSYRVEYASGRVRFYKEKNKPKTVDKFIRENRSSIENHKGSIDMIYE